jgi:hypothetical protein
MMRALVLLHRWLGVAFCLLFAMWFASGIVMHFVPFPALTEVERLAGSTVLDLAAIAHGPGDAVSASTIKDAARVRLLQRPDGPVYLLSDFSDVAALHAADLSDAALHSGRSALTVAVEHARRRRLHPEGAAIAGLAFYDQWTLPSRFDPHRPLYRIAVNDRLGTELYVSSRTGEVVLDTTRRERAWNYVGSVAHWIYPTVLRSHQTAWFALVWWLSLVALVAATAGAAVGVLRMGGQGSRLLSPYRGWQAWHHRLGLTFMLFVLTWIFSGWLSMDDGRLFSTGRPTEAEAAAVAGMPAWDTVPRDEIKHISSEAKVVEWFAFGGRIYRRERFSADQQRLFVVAADASAGMPNREFLGTNDVGAAARHLAHQCDAPAVLAAGDDYPLASRMPNAPVFRLVCGGDWFHIDGASGALLEKLDPSRRAYRWLYSSLHTLDFPTLTARPRMRTTLIVALCGGGLALCLTAIVIACRRLLSCFRLPG